MSYLSIPPKVHSSAKGNESWVNRSKIEVKQKAYGSKEAAAAEGREEPGKSRAEVHCRAA